MLVDRDFKRYSTYFQSIFEFGRRHKIMNPEKMRTNYGKLIYMLQDAASESATNLLQFSCIKPIQTVYSYLEEHDVRLRCSCAILRPPPSNCSSPSSSLSLSPPPPP